MITNKSKFTALFFAVLFFSICFQANAGLIGYWPLDETSGITATNLAPGGAIGILTNGPAWTSDAERGQVLYFDGSDDHVIAGTIPEIAISGNFTWSVWIYGQQALPNSSVILGNRWQADGSSARWIKFTSTKFEYVAVSTPHLDYADILITDGWMHHAVVKFGNRLVYYRNGVPLLTNSTVNATMPSQPFYMGGDKYGERWRGYLDDVAIWTEALPDESIAGLADGTYTPLTAPTYPFGPFDLADAVGGGDGRLPGTGGSGDLGAYNGVYTNYPNNLFVDGTFVPNYDSTPAVIDGAGHTYDFNDQCAYGTYNPWKNGLNLDTNVVVLGVTPDFEHDPDNHSLLSAHASKGICFDLDAIREFTGNSISNFTAYIGDSIPKPGGSISYFVFVDGVLVANRNNINDDFDFITVNEVFTGHYLSIAISDANNGISSDHGFIGDPFLNLIPYTPPPQPEPLTGTIIMIN